MPQFRPSFKQTFFLIYCRELDRTLSSFIGKFAKLRFSFTLVGIGRISPGVVSCEKNPIFLFPFQRSLVVLSGIFHYF